MHLTRTIKISLIPQHVLCDIWAHFVANTAQHRNTRTLVHGKCVHPVYPPDVIHELLKQEVKWLSVTVKSVSDL